jgi:hypothetical protein
LQCETAAPADPDNCVIASGPRQPIDQIRKILAGADFVTQSELELHETFSFSVPPYASALVQLPKQIVSAEPTSSSDARRSISSRQASSISSGDSLSSASSPPHIGVFSGGSGIASRH